MILRHSYDGVQRTARPTNFGSWTVSRSEGNREPSMNLKMGVLISKVSPLTPTLSPLRGEGSAIGSRHNFMILRHSYDGVQRTARPTNFGSWTVSRSGGNTELSRGIKFPFAVFASVVKFTHEIEACIFERRTICGFRIT
jgi:hypothetical protein